MDDSRLAVQELVEARLAEGRLAEGRPYGMGLGHGLKSKGKNPYPKFTPQYHEYEKGYTHGQNTKATAKHFSNPEKVGGVGLRMAAGALLPGADFAVSALQHLFSGKRPK